MKNTLTKITISLALSLAFSTAAFAHSVEKEGYLIDSRSNVVKNNYNECWRTGYWTPAMAIAECDPDLIKKEEPKATPAAPVAAGPEKAAFAKITLQAETLFDFDKSVVRADGKSKLNDEVVAVMKKHPEVEVVLVTGHADRIGKEGYNMKLSERRAAAVKAYLVSQGIEASRIETAAKGESEPVVACSDIKGKESGKNKKLVACLQPNRRVMVEVRVQKPAQ